ncbi:MAG: isoleucine--tRNA ligase [bacterium]
MFKPVAPQPDFPGQEEEVLSFWQSEKIFQKSVERNAGKTPYVIYDGPPTANAKPPLHTMVPMTFKDVVGRYRTMRGDYVRRQAGWDTHGLPVEVQIEKKLGLAGKKEVLNLVPGDEAASMRQFNDACRTSVWEFKQEWDKFVPRTGYWVDTENPYITYEPKYVEKVWETFKQIWDRDLVYKGYKVLPYCPRCGTGLSAAEVAMEYQDVKDISVFVSFPLIDNPNRLVLAWTTTPWTLPGNTALAVGKDIDYVAVSQEGREYVVAKERLEVLKGDYVIVDEFKGSELIGNSYEPLYPEPLADAEGRKFVVVHADFVTSTDGTGIAHEAPMYGEDDFTMAKDEGLALMHTVGPDGHFLPNVKEFAGSYAKDAIIDIIKDLAGKGKLYAKQTITHSYPHCWRCKTALLYYAKDSWYIAMSKLRGELVANNSQVEWFPEHIRDGRFGEFIKEARDWAVSRERFWGSPVPIWVAASGKSLCVGSFEELRSLAKDPSQVGEEFDPHRPSVDEIVLVKDGEEYFHEPFVLDVWFDSGAMPYASGREAAGEFLADYIAEAVDQTRGWFYTMQAISTATGRGTAYQRVMCMGHLVDEDGKKMSKSLGNVFDPWEMFAKHGADAIRWFLLTVNSPGESKAMSHKEIQTAFRRGLMLYWNVFNYFVTYANLADFEAPSPEDREASRQNQENALDQWILSQQSRISAEVTAHMEAYDFMRAGRTLEGYMGDLSTWYLRRSRKRDDQAFFAILHDVLMNLSVMLAPLTPFLSEQIYQTLRHDSQPQSVHLEEWPGELSGRDEKLDEEMLEVRSAVELGLSLRASEKVKVRQPLAKATAYFLRPVRQELLTILGEELNVLKVQAETTETAVSVELDFVLTDELVQAGLARDFQRTVQQLRKERGLQPGQEVLLVVDPSGRHLVEPLLRADILSDTFLRLDENSWRPTDAVETQVGGESVYIDLISS